MMGKNKEIMLNYYLINAISRAMHYCILLHRFFNVMYNILLIIKRTV